MKNYTNFGQINYDLKVLELKRKIAVEEVKGLKNVSKAYLNPMEWVPSLLLNMTSKYGKFYMLKKIFK